MTNKKISNGVRLAGKVISKKEVNGIVTMTINTGAYEDSNTNNYPQVVLFERVKNFAEKVDVGDCVTLDATLQSNRLAAGQRRLFPRTIAVNHIRKIDENLIKYMNKFDLYGRPLKVSQLDKNTAKAEVFLKGNKINYIHVIYRGTEDEIAKFMELTPKDFVVFCGYIETTHRVSEDTNHVSYSDRCICTKYIKFN